jgi:hypothetical protein
MNHSCLPLFTSFSAVGLASYFIETIEQEFSQLSAMVPTNRSTYSWGRVPRSYFFYFFKSEDKKRSSKLDNMF